MDIFGIDNSIYITNVMLVEVFKRLICFDQLIGICIELSNRKCVTWRHSPFANARFLSLCRNGAVICDRSPN